MSKTVCILRSNPVRPDSRVEKEAYSLSKNGYDVHIFAWDRDCDHPPVNEFIEVVDKKIPITRLGCKATFGEGFKNIIPYLKFQLGIRRFLKRNRFDVVHACDFDTAFFSQGVVRRKKEKFVFDIFDFLAGDPKNLFQRIIKKLQIRLINRSDAAIICTEERRKQIAESRPKRLYVIHNTPMTAQLPLCKEAKPASDAGRISVSYVGILQDYRLLPELVSFFSRRPDLEWHVGGFGKYEELFKRAAAENENIHFYGRISYEDTLKLESRCDINLAIYDPEVENHRYAAPNKFYESLMLGKPVIMVKNTGMANVVSQNDIGEVIEYSEKGFEEGLYRLIAKRDEWSKMSAEMKHIYDTEYNWSIMEQRLSELYSTL